MMSTSTYTLLIIEDFPADRELYRRALLAESNITYHLLEAESVAEGLEPRYYRAQPNPIRSRNSQSGAR
jgi:response regulator RpfG family c-di-GMP phosphodiesterase